MKLIDADALKQAILSIMPERSEVLLIVDNQPDVLAMLKSQQAEIAQSEAEIAQSEAEMMIEHKDGTVEYVKDIDNIMLLADKDYQIAYTGTF